MKRNNLIIILLSAFIFSLNINAKPAYIQEVLTAGNLLDMAAYSTKSELNIFQYENSLCIQYNYSFGELNVSIENSDTGITVIEEYINVTEGTVQNIDISGLEEGMYTIYITNNKNKCVSGTFEVN